MPSGQYRRPGPRRRSHLLTVLALVAVRALSVAPGDADAQQAGFEGESLAQPNVVLIVSDDQRYDTLRRMPIVWSELVGKGVLFRNGFVVNPVCCPSRASILTGEWSHETGVWWVFPPYGGFPAFDDHSTVATWLDDAGYQTLLEGKYLNGYGRNYATPDYVPPGWDQWFAFWTSGSCACPYFGFKVTTGADVLGFDGYSTDVLADHAVDFISSATSPFFLYVAPSAPHLPATPPARYEGVFAGIRPFTSPAVGEKDLSDKPRWVQNRAANYPSASERARTRELQLESTLAVDDLVGRVLDALETKGQLANTLIIYLSDNGFLLGEHRLMAKSNPYEASLRVPLVIRWDDGGVVPGKLLEPALNTDLAPTIAEAAGVAAPGASGKSLLPLLRREPTSWRSRFLFEHYGGLPGYCGSRGSRWKYTQYSTGEEELYNLVQDPYELANQAGRPARSARIISERRYVRDSGCRPPGFHALGHCLRSGTAGADLIFGRRSRDWICARGGNDFVDVHSGGKDTVYCGAGFDRVRADTLDELHACERRLP